MLKVPQIPISDTAQQVLTEGVELCFNLGDPVKLEMEHSSPKPVENVSISGPLTKPMKLIANGRIDIFGVCFRPGGAYAFFTYPAHEMTNGFSDAQEIWGAKGAGLVERFYNSCLKTQHRIDYLDRYFLHRLSENSRQDDCVAAAIRAIESHKGMISVDFVARKVGVSSRHLERKFKERVGLSPKQLCRSLRFKHFVSSKIQKPEGSWLDTALDCGYYDQAHMINDFKHYTGLSPSAYFENPTSIPPFFTANF
jgi:AraC-like DNA-binding protein